MEEEQLTPQQIQKRQKQKKNTQAWLKKQQQKKKKKQMLEQNGVENQKDKKKKEKKEKAEKEKQQLQQQVNQTKQVKQVKQIKTDLKPIKNQKKNIKEEVSQKLQIKKLSFKQLITLDDILQKNHPQLRTKYFRSRQKKLINQYLQKYLQPNDTVVILGQEDRQDKWQPNVCPRVFIHPYQKKYNNSNDNITCNYEDITYLMEGTITKIFVKFDILFANGATLVQKGYENIVALANAFGIPVIGYGGTWNYNGWNSLSIQMYQNKYGAQSLKEYDYLQGECYEIDVLEIGPINPKQISSHLPNLYRQMKFSQIQW